MPAIVLRSEGLGSDLVGKPASTCWCCRPRSRKKPCCVSRGRPFTPWLSRVLLLPTETMFPVVAGWTPSLRTRWASRAPPVCQRGCFCYRGAAGWPFAFELH